MICSSSTNLRVFNSELQSEASIEQAPIVSEQSEAPIVSELIVGTRQFL